MIWRLAAFLATQGHNDVWRILCSSQQSGGQMPPPVILFGYLFQQLHDKRFLLCLDDFQFVEGDPHVHHFTDQLHASLSPHALRAIITARQTPHFIQGQPQRVTAPLGGLNAIETYHFVAQSGLVLSDALLNTLFTYTGGNAQFLTLAVATLHQTDDGQAYVEKLATAEDVEAYLLVQIDRHLNEVERAVMGAVALCMGVPTTRDRSEAILERSDLQRTLLALCNRQLLIVTSGQAERSYEQHGMVRDFYYNLLGRRDRLVMHRRAGMYYEEVETTLLLAARHWLAAQEFQHAAKLVTPNVSR